MSAPHRKKPRRRYHRGGSEQIIEVIDPDGNKKQFRKIEVAGDGNCMFRALALASTETSDEGYKNVRAGIVDKYIEILEKNDTNAIVLLVNILKYMIDLPESVIKAIEDENLKTNLQGMITYDVRYIIDDETKIKEYVTKIKEKAKYAAPYTEWMSYDKAWGGSVELQMATKYFQRPIYLYQTWSDITKPHTIGEEYFPGKVPIRIWFNGENHYDALLPLSSPSSSTHPSPAATKSASPPPGSNPPPAATKTASASPTPTPPPPPSDSNPPRTSSDSNRLMQEYYKTLGNAVEGIERMIHRLDERDGHVKKLKESARQLREILQLMQKVKNPDDPQYQEVRDYLAANKELLESFPINTEDRYKVEEWKGLQEYLSGRHKSTKDMYGW